MIRFSSATALALAVGLAAPAVPISAQLGSHNPEPGPQETVAIVGARLVPVLGDVIANGTLVISGGRITAIGANAQVPSGARVIDGSGLSVYPGMMDAATSMGLIEIEQGANATIDVSETGNFNPNAQALWGIDPHSAHIGVTRVAGITHVVSRPTGGLISGQAAVVNLAGYTAPVMAVEARSALVIQVPGQGGRGGGRFGGGQQSAPPDGMSPLDSLEQMIDDARAYDKAMKAYDSDSSLPRPTVDLGLAALVPAVDGRMPVIFPAETEAAIKEAVEFAEKHDLKPIIVGARDAWRMTDYLVTHQVPVIFGRTLSLPSRDDDGYDSQYAAAAKLAAAGVTFAISSGESNPDVRNLPYVAGMAAAFGLSADDALKAVTIWPAQIFGVDDRLGSLTVGKMANLVVTTGDILEARTDTRHLFIDGREVPLGTRHTDLYDTFKDRR